MRVPARRSPLALWQLEDGTYRFTGHTTATDAQGRYLFGLGLNLQPGVYQVRETQPAGLFSVGAVPGTVAGVPAGRIATIGRGEDAPVATNQTEAGRAMREACIAATRPWAEDLLTKLDPCEISALTPRLAKLRSIVDADRD